MKLTVNGIVENNIQDRQMIETETSIDELEQQIQEILERIEEIKKRDIND